jgi:regulator of protease activity HflC (stomatin/prohibitin superfamily)
LQCGPESRDNRRKSHDLVVLARSRARADRAGNGQFRRLLHHLFRRLGHRCRPGKQQQINEAEGQAAAILAVATATAEGLRRVADAMRTEGGMEAVQLRVAEQYIAQFGELAKSSNTLVLPANAADVGSMIALAMKVITGTGADGGTVPPIRQ